ncbi:MAG: O-methyltransferase [Candidatus Fonsibacter sp.]
MFKTLDNFNGLEEYLFKFGLNEHAIQKEIREFTDLQYSSRAINQISPDQASLIQFIIKFSNIQNCLEIGTFTGYSAITMALALPENGSVTSIDNDKDVFEVAKKFWNKVKQGQKIDFILSDGNEALDNLIHEKRNFELIFIDADKQNYKNYFLKSLELIDKDGILLIDNTLWKGKVFNFKIQDDQTKHIRDFNQFVKNSKLVESMILPVADGMTICRKI